MKQINPIFPFLIRKKLIVQLFIVLLFSAQNARFNNKKYAIHFILKTDLLKDCLEITSELMNRQSIYRKKSTSEIICQNFKLPAQTIFQDYKCTLKGNVTFFGRLYIGEEHLMFISNMFGIIKKCVIDIQKVNKVESQNQSATSIIITVKSQEPKDNQFIFGGFKNNNAFKLILALWKRQKIASEFLRQQQDLAQHEQHMLKGENNRISQVGTQIDYKIQQGKIQANFFNPETVENQKMKIVQVSIPCSVEQFYDFFLDDKAIVYPKRKHFEFKKAEKVVCTEWKQNKQLNSFIRQFSAIIKVVGVPFKNTAPMSQVWQLKKDQNFKQKGFQYNVVTQMADIPYAAYFNCEETIQVLPLSSNKCSMLANVSIVFNKSTYMKGTILKRTLADMKEDYELWVNNVNEILTKMSKKPDQIKGNVANEGAPANLQKSKSLESQKKGKIQYEQNLPIKDLSPLKPIRPNSESAQEIKKLSERIKILTYLMGALVIINLLQFIVNLGK